MYINIASGLTTALLVGALGAICFILGVKAGLGEGEKRMEAVRASIREAEAAVSQIEQAMFNYSPSP